MLDGGMCTREVHWLFVAGAVTLSHYVNGADLRLLVVVGCFACFFH